MRHLKMKIRWVNSIFLVILVSSCCSGPPVVSDDLLDCNTQKYKKPLEENVALFNAAKAGDAKTCKEQLERFADINVADRLGQSALMWAAWQGSDDVVKCFLEFDRETRIRIKNKKRVSRKIHLLDYSTESNPKYNPLFAIVSSHGMQVPNAIECINLLLENETNFANVKKNSLLLKVDTFGENILHKAVRSGSLELLSFFIEKLEALPDKKETFKSFLDAPNTSGESPLIVAVKNRSADMTDLLINKGADILKRDGKGKEGEGLLELAFDKGDGNYDTYLIIMKARLRRHNAEKKERKEKAPDKPYVAKYTRKDRGLEKAFEAYHKRFKKDVEGDRFFQTYRKFAETGKMRVEDPEDLEDETYKNKKDDFFAMLVAKGKSERDLDAINELIRENPFLLECGYKRNKTEKREVSALEIAIEERDERLFDVIFDQTNMNRIRSSTVYGDYLKCAIKNDNPKVIKKLLDYNSNPTGVQGHIIEKLMSPININSYPNPIIEYLAYKDLREDMELLESLLAYYKIELKGSSVPANIFAEAMKYDDENILLLLYELSSPKDYFYIADKDIQSGRYLHFVMLEKKFFRALNLLMQNSRFMENKWYSVKDPQNNNKTFEDMLNESLANDEIRNISSHFMELKELYEK